MKPILFSLLLMLSTAKAFAENYHINTEQQLKEILTRVKAGDRIIIANGIYHNWNIEIPNRGTPAKPIVISAEVPGQVIFSGEIADAVFRLTGSDVVLQGLYFRDCNLIKSNGKTGSIIDFKNTERCTLSTCSFVNNTVKAQFMPLVIVSGNGLGNQISDCTFIGNVDSQDVQVKITEKGCPKNTLISNNVFKDKKKVSWKNGNGGECIQVGQDPINLGTIVANTTVIGNHFTNCNGESEIISNKSSGNKYLKNHFENNDGELVMRGGHDCTIDQNIFEGGTGGIRINGTGHMVTNNKINKIKTAIRLMYGMAKGKESIGFYIAASDCTIKNNIITNADVGILVGDSKDVDWTGKFDTKKYPSPVIQNIAPFDNHIEGNKISNTVTRVVTN